MKFLTKFQEPTNSAPQGEAITVSPDEVLSDLYIVHKYINMYADKITRLYTEDKESYKVCCSTFHSFTHCDSELTHSTTIVRSKGTESG